MSGSRGLASRIDRRANWKSSATCCHLIVFSISTVALNDAVIGLWASPDNSQLVAVAAILVSDTQGW